MLFLGDAPDQLAAKTADGIARWRPELCVGQLRLPKCKADIGLPDMTLEEASAAGAQTLAHVAARAKLTPRGADRCGRAAAGWGSERRLGCQSVAANARMLRTASGTRTLTTKLKRIASLPSLRH